jgi:hypothetical protein
VKSDGADFVKVYNLLGRESFFAIADEAKAQNLPLQDTSRFKSGPTRRLTPAFSQANTSMRFCGHPRLGKRKSGSS